MKQFIYRILFFGLAVMAISVMLILINDLLVRRTIYTLDPEKTSVILGDSNSQCDINDSIFSSTINLSESAAPYFYSYLKLKKLFRSESNIDTVFLSIAPHNIFDNGWLGNEKIIYSNMGRNLPVMEFKDFMVLYHENPGGTIGALRAIPEHIVQLLRLKLFHKELSELGGYFYLDRNMLSEDIRKLRAGEPLDFFRIPENFKVSEKEVTYLHKIEGLCRENDKLLILLFLPKREEILAYEKYGVKEFYDFYDRELSNIPMIDDSRINLPEGSFADLVHLNHKGAAVFSRILNDEVPVLYSVHNLP